MIKKHYIIKIDKNKRKINTDKYGQKVTNYTVQTLEMSTNVWRLFYQDSNYTYMNV